MADPLTSPQLDLLRRAAEPGGTIVLGAQNRAAKRLVRLGFAEWAAPGLLATDRGREHLRRLGGD